MSERFPAPVAAAVLLIYIAGTLFVGLHHEPWRDEADAWLVARDLPLTDMLPQWTAHAGAPVVWYLVLKAIVSTGLPYLAETLANLAFAWAAAAVLLFRAPFSRITQLLFLLSYFMAYEYAVIARSYALAVLLVFVALASQAHPLRYAIILALLFNTSVHAAIFAAALLLAGPRTKEMSIAIGGALVTLWQLWPRGEGNPLAMRGFQLGAITALRDVFVPFSTTMWTALLSLAILIGIALTLRSRPALFVLVFCTTALLALYSLVWFGGLRASGMILIAVIAAMWIAGGLQNRIVAIALNTTLAVSAAFAIVVSYTDVRYAFSGSKEMAQFIDDRLDNYDIAAHNFYSAEAILPYLPGRQFWYIGLGEYGTYLKWNAPMRRGAAMPYEVAVVTAKQHFAQSKRPWLLLLNSKMPQPERWGFHLLHATSVTVFRNLDERYWLYTPNPLVVAGDRHRDPHDRGVRASR